MATHPRVLDLERIPTEEQDTPGWHAKRAGMLTASLYPAVLGNDKYKTRQALFRSLVGAGGGGSYASGFMQHGKDNEGPARQRYEQETGETVVEFGCISHAEAAAASGGAPGHASLGGSPDGITLSGRLIEIKCPASREIVPGEVPGQYVDQIQGLMWLLDLEACDFIEYKPHVDPVQFVITPVDRDPGWAATNVPILLQFWKDVQSYREREEACRRGAAKVCAKAVEAHFAALEHRTRIDWERQEWNRLWKPKRRTKRKTPPRIDAAPECMIVD